MTEPFGVDPDMAVRPTGTYRRWAIRVLLAIVALNIIVFALRALDDPRVDGPPGSSFVTTEHGHGAWHDLLVDIGRETRRTRMPFPEATVDPSAAVVAISPDPTRVDDAYTDGLRDHVENGGLVVTSSDAPWFDALVQGTELDRLANDAFLPGPALPPSTGVARVDASGVGSFTVLGETRALLTDGDGRHLAVAHEVGAGIVVALSDITPLSNEMLAQADNAAFAIAITDGRGVVFDEHIHGYTSGGGIAEVPLPVRVMLGVLLAAAVTWMWAVGKRFGPPEQLARHLPLARARYVDGLSNALVKTTAGEGAYGGLRQRGLLLLDRQAHGHTGTPSDTRVAAAEAAGLSPPELAALERPIANTDDAAAVAAAVAKLEERRLLASSS